MAKSEALRTTSAADARAHFMEVINEVRDSQTPIVVDQDGEPVVVLLAFDSYERLLQDVRLARFEHLSRAAGRVAEHENLTEDQLEQEMEAIKQRLFQETYGRLGAIPTSS